jgi:hypothetical protein
VDAVRETAAVAEHAQPGIASRAQLCWIRGLGRLPRKRHVERSKIHKDDEQKVAALTVFLLELLLVFLGQEEGLVVDGVLHLRQKQGRQMARLSNDGASEQTSLSGPAHERSWSSAVKLRDQGLNHGLRDLPTPVMFPSGSPRFPPAR